MPRALRRSCRHARPRRHLDASLERLGLDSIELYQVHWPLLEDQVATVFTELAALLAQGHQSLVELFEVTVPATDTLVAIAKDALGNRVAARQTGGGFGGAVVCICEQDDVELLLAAVQQHYHQQTGLEATSFVCTPGRGLECVIHE